MKVCVPAVNQVAGIWRIAIAGPLRGPFDYLPPDIDPITPIQTGIRVRVPFGRRTMVGILVEITDRSDFELTKLKTVIEILDIETAIPINIFKLCQWVANYYHASLGEVLMNALPPKLRRIPKQSKRKARAPKEKIELPIAKTNDATLNEQQQSAVAAIIAANGFNVFLLNGITGSGKTEVYLHVIADLLQQNKQALILVPEISLTPQTVQRFQAFFGFAIAVYHSGLTDNERVQTWQQAKGGVAPIVIGTRSAVFLPFKNLGLIVIDEEHDLSFKQQEGFRYSARDVAIVRARLQQVPIILGSATPSVETIENVQKNRYQELILSTRATGATIPTIRIVDIRKLKLIEGLSQPLIETISCHLANHAQVLLFLNRRGYAPVLMCHACGYVFECKHCDARLVLHQKPYQLHCHHCGLFTAVPAHCAQCQEKQLFTLGMGTERLEEIFAKQFPAAEIIRIDSDSTRNKGALTEKLAAAKQGRGQILIGTQMLAKGHDFPNLTLVAILDADSGFYGADFRNTERMGQLLLQVAGRAGRGAAAGEVIIQTRHPEHPLLNCILNNDYAAFTEIILQDRLQNHLPPYGHLALLRVMAKQAEFPMHFLQELINKIKPHLNKQIELLGPIPSPMTRKAGHYRAQLLIQASQRKSLHDLLNHLTNIAESLTTAKRVRWSLDVDPLEMFA